MNDIERGSHAEKLLSDPLLIEAFESKRVQLLLSLEDLPMTDAVGAEQIRLSLKLLKGLRADLEGYVRDGKVAAQKLEAERNQRESSLKTRFTNWRASRG